MRRSYADRIARATRNVFILFEVTAVLVTGAALADELFNLGWGYDWKDVLGGVGIGLFGVLVYLVCLGIFRAFERVQ